MAAPIHGRDQQIALERCMIGLELPGGRLLGALSLPDGIGRFGMRTSDDGGYSWGTG